MLAKPWFYRTFRWLVTSRAGRGGLVDDFIRPQVGDRVLDIGCGTADVLDDLPLVQYHGFDTSEAYIEQARRRYGTRGTFTNAQVGRDTVVGEFDLVIALGVLHHLPDTDAEELFRLAQSVLKSGGRFVSVDPCFHQGQSLLRKYVISLDRGGYVRTVDEYTDLARGTFSDVVSHTRTGLVRIPYTHIIMECIR